MITLVAAAEQFLIACRADGLKPPTVRWYAGKLSPFVAALSDVLIDQVPVTAVRQYIVALRERDHLYPGQTRARKGGLSTDSLRGHIRMLKRFFTWCVLEYNLDPASNPMVRIKMPSKPKHLPKAIDLNDLVKLIQSTDESMIGIRDRAMLYFLADTGCRAAGMLNLTLDNLNLDAHRATLTEKGDRTRIVPFTEDTAYMLRRWLTLRPDKATTVFCALNARSFGNQLTREGLHLVLKKLARRAGVQGRVNPHSFRHGFARQYLLNGGDLITLSGLLGHSDLTTTRVYAAFTEAEHFAQHEKFSPIHNVEVLRRGH